MEDREFFDLLYQQWSKTTGAENRFWAVEEDVDYIAGGPNTWNIVAIDQEQNREIVACWFDSEEDADWVAAMHGCFADLYRRLHEALDDAESADLRADEQSSVAADALIEHAALERKHNELDAVARGLREQVSELKHEIRGLEDELEEKYL
ncbi:hypothetical protein SEA_STEPHIG9_37 [Mycobacterium phage Stephig9]|uniref:Uncharacterized protein n=1 Tax=Mycobacterium phage Stephig9 TaxID=2591224 RepID=A0A514DH99_9CAUD|nr:hypothetical protein SEA_STEPHIG9_37 [Mycobacterium phage Stephig9]